MGSQTSRTWLFENVLFFDPEAHPTGEGARDVNATGLVDNLKKGDKKRDAESLHEIRRVKIYAPSEIGLRAEGSKYLVDLDIDGLCKSLVIHILSEPKPIFHIENKNGDVLWTFLVDRVFYMQRNGKHIDVVLEMEGLKRQFGLVFEDGYKAAEFSNDCLNLAGIYVKTYGRLNPLWKDQRISKEDVICPLHKTSFCNCSFTTAGPADESQFAGEIVEDESEIKIEGTLQIGSDLSVKEKKRESKGTERHILEWQVSQFPGKDPQFDFLNNKSFFSPVFVIQPNMAGHYIRLRRSKRNATLSEQDQPKVLISATTKGPIGLDDLYAKGLLKLLTAANRTYVCSISTRDLQGLFSLPKSGQKGFHELVLIVSRTGLEISCYESNADNTYNYSLENFCVWQQVAFSRELNESSDEASAIMTIRVNMSTERIRIKFSSVEERDIVIHFTFLHRTTSLDERGYELWDADYQKGNFARIRSFLLCLYSYHTWAEYLDVTDPPEESEETEIAEEEQRERERGEFAPYPGEDPPDPPYQDLREETNRLY